MDNLLGPVIPGIHLIQDILAILEAVIPAIAVIRASAVYKVFPVLVDGQDFLATARRVIAELLVIADGRGILLSLVIVVIVVQHL